jgi:hypothetical protein
MKMHKAACAVIVTALTIAVGTALAHEPTAENAQEVDSALGKLLFTKVVRVDFVGPGFPANPDGSLGGLVADEKGVEMKIYENFICREFTDQTGVIARELRAYEKLGRIEQRGQATAIGKRDAGQDHGDNTQWIVPPAQGDSEVSSSRPDSAQELGIRSLAEQFQKAKDKGSKIGFYASQGHFSGKVIEVNAERGIAHLKNEDGFDLFVRLARVEALLILSK